MEHMSVSEKPCGDLDHKTKSTHRRIANEHDTENQADDLRIRNNVQGRYYTIYTS